MWVALLAPPKPPFWPAASQADAVASEPRCRSPWGSISRAREEESCTAGLTDDFLAPLMCRGYRSPRGSTSWGPASGKSVLTASSGELPGECRPAAIRVVDVRTRCGVRAQSGRLVVQLSVLLARHVRRRVSWVPSGRQRGKQTLSPLSQGAEARGPAPRGPVRRKVVLLV